MNSSGKKRLVWGVFLVVASLLFSGSGTRAADWFVTPGGSGDGSQSSPCTLDVALTGAQDGDVLYLGAGSYRTFMSGNVALISNSVTLLGGWNGAATGAPVRDPSAHVSALDGGTGSRVVALGPNLSVTLDGLTIEGGYTETEGAGIYSEDSDLIVENCQFLNNYALSYSGVDTFGGGLRFLNGDLTVRKSRFYQNGAWCQGCINSSGGGIFASTDGAVFVEECVFEANTAWSGGGFCARSDAGGTFTVKDSSFRENGKIWSGGYTGYGGGAYLQGNIAASFEGCTFSQNQASNDGGALCLEGTLPGALGVDRCWILHNEANIGGGILVRNGNLTLTNAVLAHNSCFLGTEGAISLRIHTSAVLDHVTLSENVRQDGSGYAVLAVGDTSVSIQNAIFAAHAIALYADVGGTIQADGVLWGTGAWANGFETGGSGTVTVGSTAVSGDPGFVDPAGGDYHITSASAAVDHGIDSGVHHDIDGNPRPIGAAVDIGADEYAPPPVVTSIVKKGTPFRFIVNGSNLQPGIRVYINGTEWNTRTYKSSSKVVLKGGVALKAALPKNTSATLRFVNPDGGQASLNWKWP